MQPTASTRGSQAPASRWLIPLAGLTGGVAIANVFYSQPLLATVAIAFGTDAASVAIWPTRTQAGFAVGLLLILPFGDVFDRRRLAAVLLLLAAASLIASALAPTLTILALAGVAVGLASIVSQLLVAFAADVASDTTRGRVVAWVMTGVLMGVQIARTVSGVLGGWVAVCAIGGALGGIALLLWLHERRLSGRRQPPTRLPIEALGRAGFPARLAGDASSGVGHGGQAVPADLSSARLA